MSLGYARLEGLQVTQVQAADPMVSGLLRSSSRRRSRTSERSDPTESATPRFACPLFVDLLEQVLDLLDVHLLARATRSQRARSLRGIWGRKAWARVARRPPDLGGASAGIGIGLRWSFGSSVLWKCIALYSSASMQSELWPFYSEEP